MKEKRADLKIGILCKVPRHITWILVEDRILVETERGTDV